MSDFWIDVLLTILVTTVIIFADWLASIVIASSKGMTSIGEIMREKISEAEKVNKIKEEITKFYSTKSSQLNWGSDLAALAFSMNIAILGLWIYHPEFFPFISRLNSQDPEISRELLVWLIILLINFVVLLLTLLLKHFHVDRIARSPDLSNVVLTSAWMSINKFMIIGNLFGFLSLLFGFVVVTNAI